MRACCNRPGPCQNYPGPCCSRPGVCCSRPESAVLFSTLQVLTGAAGRRPCQKKDQEPDFSGRGANPNRPQGGWGPLRTRGSLPDGRAGFGVPPMDREQQEQEHEHADD